MRASDLTAADHIRALNRHAQKQIFDFALINRTPVSDELKAKYASEGACQIVNDLDAIEALGVIPVLGDYLDEGGVARHNTARVARDLMELIAQRPRPRARRLDRRCQFRNTLSFRAQVRNLLSRCRRHDHRLWQHRHFLYRDSSSIEARTVLGSNRSCALSSSSLQSSADRMLSLQGPDPTCRWPRTGRPRNRDLGGRRPFRRRRTRRYRRLQRRPALRVDHHRPPPSRLSARTLRICGRRRPRFLCLPARRHRLRRGFRSARPEVEFRAPRPHSRPISNSPAACSSPTKTSPPTPTP